MAVSDGHGGSNVAPFMLAMQRTRNLLAASLLLTTMAMLTTILGWLVFGPEGFLVTLVAATVLVVLGTRWSAPLLLRWTGAKQLEPHQAPRLHVMVANLARLAGLGRAPTIFFVPSSAPQAFSIGARDDAALAVTGGLLEQLGSRELNAVLAHEVSHIRTGDAHLMALAGVFGRLTAALSTVGLLFVILDLVLLLAGGESISPLLLAALLVAPTISTLLHLALSRSRELSADLGAVALTGDLSSLVSALHRLEQPATPRLMDQLLPWTRLPRRQPRRHLWSTHPETAERIRRLLALAPTRPGPVPLRVDLMNSTIVRRRPHQPEEPGRATMWDP